MENNYIKLILTEKEIELIQLLLTYYIVEERKNKGVKDYRDRAIQLSDNINFYKRQKGTE